MPPANNPPDNSKLDKIVLEARRNSAAREKSYRGMALKMYPWVCGRCAREFNQKNLQGLTVHHIDHDHDNNPADGSNWELLCVYCHDEEHAKYADREAADPGSLEEVHDPHAKQNPFAGLKDMLKAKDNK